MEQSNGTPQETGPEEMGTEATGTEATCSGHPDSDEASGSLAGTWVDGLKEMGPEVVRPDDVSPEEIIAIEMNAVLQEGLRIAAEALTQAESFRPFAVAYRPDGQLERAELTSDDPEATISAEEAHQAVFSVLKQRAEEVHAVGVVSDVVLSQEGEAQGEAIRIELEHRDPAARVLAAWATYTRDEPGSVSFSEQLGTSESARRIWV